MNERRKKDLLLRAGDIIVLNAIPWRASDDTIFGTTLLEGEDEELGMQLVVEASIFNPDAELPPTKGKDVPLATCHERELQPLAKVAQDIHSKLAQGNFVDIVVRKMESNEALGEKQMSPFYYTFEDKSLGRKSQVITSWTIKTDIGKGSSRIDFASSDIPMDILLLTLLLVIIGYTFWSLRLYSTRKRKDAEKRRDSESSSPSRRGKYSRVESNGNHSGEDEGESLMAIAADDIYHDEKSVMSTITEYTAESRGESVQSLGSLSVYLARTGKPYVPMPSRRSSREPRLEGREP